MIKGVIVLVILNRPCASRSSEFEITHSITSWTVLHSVQLLLLICRFILKYWNKMAELLFGPPCVRQIRARIYPYNDSILIYSNQQLRIRYRFGRASIEYNTNLIKADLQRKTNCYYAMKRIDQVLIASQFYACGSLRKWLTASCRRYNWSWDKSTVSLAVHNADAILETIAVLTHGKLHYGILIVD